MEKDLLRTLYEGANQMKECIKADSIEVYLIQDGKIYRSMYKYGCYSLGASWPIGPGTLVAAYVAFVEKGLTIDNFKENAYLYPLGTGREPKPKHLISLPLLSENKDCFGVIELVRTTRSTFTSIENNMFDCMVGWLGQSIRMETEPYTNVVVPYNSLFSTLDQFLRVHSKLEIFIKNVLSLLHKIVSMEKANYYQIRASKEVKCKMIAQVGNDDWEYFPEHILKDGSFIKEVAEKSTVKNLSKRDIASLDQFFRSQLKDVHSYLCIPLGIESNTLGVIELINRKGSDNFLEKDVTAATACGIYCAAGLHYIDNYSKQQRSFAMSENQELTLVHYLLPCSHDFETFKYEFTNFNTPRSFLTLSYYPSQDQLPYLPQYIWYIFREIFKVDETDGAVNTFLNFILIAKQGYRNSNSYHNFEHAFNFCHCLYIIVRTNANIFTDLERKALIVAALCHDIDHPGITNKFIKDTGNTLSKLYNESFLENHHSSLCRMIVKHCKIFSDLNSIDYTSAMKIVNSSILDTDLSGYFTARYKMMNILTENSFTLQDNNHRKLLRSMLMTACDLSGQVKTFRVSERLCRNIYKEFFSEAELTARLGLETIFVMIKDNIKEIPKYQVEFISEVCLPCFYIIGIVLENTKELQNRCSDNCEKWDKIITSGINWDVFKEEYQYTS